MSTRNDVKNYLNQTRHIDHYINLKLEQLASLKTLATKTTAVMSDMPGSPNRNTHPMENVIVKMIDLEKEIDNEIDRLVDLKSEITRAIKLLDNREYRIILEQRYLNFASWEDIAIGLGYSTSWVWKLHQKALKALGSVIDEMEVKVSGF